MTTDTTNTAPSALQWRYPEYTAPTATLDFKVGIPGAYTDVCVLLTKHNATTVSAYAYRVLEFGAQATTIRTVCHGKTEEQLLEFARLMATQLAVLVDCNGGTEDA
jgi:hypothetical protein